MTLSPDKEDRRQEALDALPVDRFAETALDDLTHFAAEIFDVPISTISIIDRDRQWFKSVVGIEAGEGSARADAFCDHTIRKPGELLVVEDATKDERFASNPFVTAEGGLRFYAAAPLTLSSGHAIGAVCVMDTQPRQIDPEKLKQLRFMADQVVATLEARQAPNKG